jgi:PmbA protein
MKILNEVIDKAIKQGASDVDAILINSSDLSAEVRLGNVIGLERSESMAIGLRVLINGKQAMVSSADLNSNSLDKVVERAIAMAKVTPVNPHLFLAREDQLAKEFKELNLYDANEPSAEKLIELAKEIEQSALDNKEITNSDGASTGYQSSKIHFATSKGFQHSYQTSSSGRSLSVIAGKGENMQTDYAYSVARFAQDIKSSKEIGLEAAKRAIEKLNPRKLNTAEMPVIFERRLANLLLGSFAGAINGFSISRGTSFLIDHLGKEIFNPNINIIDDPFIIKGLGSRPFDAEGIMGSKMNIIENGVLNSYLLDLQTASKLKMETTGHASRGLSSAPTPSTTNMYMEAGTTSVDDMIKSMKKGLLITDILGHGANIVTGEYSQGVAGFYIENGEIAYPVSEMTIASNLKEMFKNMIPASDLKFEGSTNSPSLLVEKMIVAGV